MKLVWRLRLVCLYVCLSVCVRSRKRGEEWWEIRETQRKKNTDEEKWTKQLKKDRKESLWSVRWYYNFFFAVLLLLFFFNVGLFVNIATQLYQPVVATSYCKMPKIKEQEKTLTHMHIQTDRHKRTPSKRGGTTTTSSIAFARVCSSFFLV